jgi:hypothetical protein
VAVPVVPHLEQQSPSNTSKHRLEKMAKATTVKEAIKRFEESNEVVASEVAKVL